DIIKYDMTPIYLRILKKNLANVNDEEKLMINYIARVKLDETYNRLLKANENKQEEINTEIYKCEDLSYFSNDNVKVNYKAMNKHIKDYEKLLLLFKTSLPKK